MTLWDLITPVTSSTLPIKLKRLHTLLQPSKTIIALAVIVQTPTLTEHPVLLALARLAIIPLGGGEGDGGAHPALL